MPIKHTNVKGVTYYLHQGVTKTGKPRYHFSPESQGAMEGDLPAGYEVYETPATAQVFLRKQTEKLICDEERDLVVARMQKHQKIKLFKVDIKGKTITLWVAQTSLSVGDDHDRGFRRTPDPTFLQKMANYSAEMRFVLTDEGRRLFSVERYCYRGSVDDWISISRSDTLEKQLDTFLVHLGQASFFDLY